jgi:RHS repeat-associated protein
MQSANVDAKFVYNENGLRVQKIVNGVVTDYVLHGKNVVHMTKGNDELHFFYDAQNRPAVVVYNNVPYAYVKNLQGDIVAILDENGNTVVSYGYDAWGAPLWCTGELAETLGKVQPFRYRGYVFDEETGLYYLRSRYYNPRWGRFVNADALISTFQKSSKHNLFSYCGNSVISYMDPAGLFAIQGLLLAGVLAACTLLLSGCAAKTDYGEASTYKPTTSTKYNCYAYALGETEWKYVGGSPDAVQDFSVENVAKWYWMMQKLMEGLCASLILMIVPSIQMSTELH